MGALTLKVAPLFIKISQKVKRNFVGGIFLCRLAIAVMQAFYLKFLFQFTLMSYIGKITKSYSFMWWNFQQMHLKLVSNRVKLGRHEKSLTVSCSIRIF